MRKIIVAGILALVVIGCVLVAGCTTTTGNGGISGTMTDNLIPVVVDDESVNPHDSDYADIENMGESGAVSEAETLVPVPVKIAIKGTRFTTSDGHGNYCSVSGTDTTITADAGSKMWLTKFELNDLSNEAVLEVALSSKRYKSLIDLHYFQNGEEKQMTIISGTGDGKSLYSDDMRFIKLSIGDKLEVKPYMEGLTLYF